MIYSLRHPKRAQQDIDLIDTWPEFLKDLKEGLESRMPFFNKLMTDEAAVLTAVKPLTAPPEVLSDSTSGLHPPKMFEPVRHVTLPILDVTGWPKTGMYYKFYPGTK